MLKSCRQQDCQYETYYFTVKEKIQTGIMAIAVVIFLAYIFYKSYRAVLFLSPLSIAVWKYEKNKKLTEKRKKLSREFKDCLQSVGTNLKAGYSAENAFLESIKDISFLYGPDCDMVKELLRMKQALRNKIPLENILLSLGKRSQIPDIVQFAEVFAIAKRSGGNLADIFYNTLKVMNEKMETDQEIQVLLSAKKMEQKIMSMIPFMIILYISFTSPGFFDVMYHSVAGVIVMTGCLAVYFGAFYLSSRIVNINLD